MKYSSLNNPAHRVSFQEAVVQGLAPDGGLFMPEQIPMLSQDFISKLPELSDAEIAFTIARQFIDETYPDEVLYQIVRETVDFEFPLIPVSEGIFALELFHGPTWAFKDVGARFMARILKHIARNIKQEITVLVATSGDTGSAVAHGFYRMEGIRVIILYPEGKVSPLQEKQLATLGHNITAIKIAGTFDDCQRLVKTAFQDADLRHSLLLTSANSINIARLIPQTFYYFFGYSKLPVRDRVVFSVPSGNFGNLTAGVLAKKMGLPVHAFIASTNINDVVPAYLQSKHFQPRASKATISNAMDVGNPSNFARLSALYDNEWKKMSHDVVGYSFTDDETRKIIKETFDQTGYTLDPHGAVAWLGLKEYREKNKIDVGIFLETAHPAKFPEVVAEIIQQPLTIPPAMAELQNKPITSIPCSSDFQEFKKLLLDHG
jgi:threonine synthase